ncbi:MAG: hypothetical protein P8N26_00790 [Cyclobacteriaceae bacterium]|nr:hypothetical protein [Cyclobacteriaceae bacterium]
MKKLILPILVLLSLTFYSCSDEDAVVDGITLDRGSVTFTLDGESKNFTLLNSFTIDDTDTTVLLAFGDSDSETLGFVFDLPTSFPSELGDEAIGTYSVDDLSYGAISGLVGSIELNISSYENDVMSGTFSMIGIKTSEDIAGRDSVIVTNGIFTNIPTSGL